MKDDGKDQQGQQGLLRGNDELAWGGHRPLPLRGGWSGIPPPGDAGEIRGNVRGARRFLSSRLHDFVIDRSYIDPFEYKV